MRHITFLSALILSIVGGMATVAGCSLIGLAIGASSDSHRQKTIAIPGWEIESVKRGTSIEIIGKNGHRVEGLYTGIQSRSIYEYAASFDARAEEVPAINKLPPPGDSVNVSYLNGAHAEGILLGYYVNAIAVRVNDVAPARTVPFDQIKSFRGSSGMFVQPAVLSQLIQEGELPVLNAVAYVADSESRQIPVDDVDRITYRSSTHGAITGFLIGAAIDAFVLLKLASDEKKASQQQSSWCQGNSCTSCPLVYSFNGDEYVLDSETYGGAIFEAAQRTDLDNLDHLNAVDGFYRLSLRNENDETEYVDKLSILVVDHEPDSRLIPTFSGSLQTVKRPEPPVSAVNRYGADILQAIRETDEDVWVSNPLDRDPRSVESTRDGMELEFDRPQGTDEVKLVFNVQNTWWVPYLAGQILRLPGRELDSWYDELNSRAEARAALTKAIIREGALRIEVWNGTDWQYGGFVWEVGPSLAKDVVVVVALPTVNSDKLKIKLGSTAGLWMINSVQADYSVTGTMNITEIFPTSAVTESGADVTEVLKSEDGSYYVMPTMQDRAELVFSVPPPVPGLARTPILSTSGYYKIHISPAGEPQQEFLTRLLTEPGAIAAFSAARMNELVKSAVAELME